MHLLALEIILIARSLFASLRKRCEVLVYGFSESWNWGYWFSLILCWPAFESCAGHYSLINSNSAESIPFQLRDWHVTYCAAFVWGFAIYCTICILIMCLNIQKIYLKCILYLQIVSISCSFHIRDMSSTEALEKANPNRRVRCLKPSSV